MCHIIHCVSLTLDLIQRLITYLFACFIFFIIYIALTAALIAGMTYGYKYYLAEYYTINSTLHAIRKISLDPMRSELAEFDAKHYKSLIDYYEHQATSTEETAATGDEAAAEALRQNLNLNTLPTLMGNQLLPEDDTDRAIFDLKEDKERPTVEPDNTLDINEYVKKINWIVSKESETEMPASNLVPRTKSTSQRLSEYAYDRPLIRYLMPVNKMAVTSTTKKESGIKYQVEKLKSAFSYDNVMRRTLDPQIFNTTTATFTFDSKEVGLLLKHLSTVSTEANTVAVLPITILQRKRYI